MSRGGLLVPDRPGGGHNDYAGHVFWDMDTWMLPPIMLFHPDMAKRMIGSRSRVLNQVKKNAEEAGYKGAKFPWEQATTGDIDKFNKYFLSITLNTLFLLENREDPRILTYIAVCVCIVSSFLK